MGVDAIIRIGIGTILLVSLFAYLETVLFVFGLFFGSINSIFNYFTYIGASCELVEYISSAFYLVGFGFLLMAFFRIFYHK